MKRAAAVTILLASVFVACSSDVDGPQPVELWVGDNSRPYMPRPRDVAQFVKGDLEAAGFEVVIKSKEWGTYLDETSRGAHQLCLLGWSTDNGDPDNFLYTLLDQDNAVEGSATNVSFYRSDELHAILTRAQRLQGAEERATAYKEAQALLHREVPMVPLVYAKIAHAMRSDVADFHQNPIGTVRLHTVRFTGSPGGILKFARGSDSVHFDPIKAEDGESIKVLDNIYEGLVEHDLDTPELRPGLASRWTVSPDGKTWTFHLREGVTFHDGSPLDAESVVVSFRRLLAYEGAPYGSNYNMIASVEAAGELEVVFGLDAASSVFLPNLAMHPAYIVSRKAIAAGEAALDRNPVGTGPFRFDEWVPDTKVSIVRNEAYWDAGEKAKLDQIIYLVERDPTARVQRLRDGHVHFADNLNFNDFESLEKDAGVRLMIRDGMNFCYLAMNNDKAPFKGNRLLRQAVAHAINKERIISRAYAGYAAPAVHPMPPTLRITDATGKTVDPWAHDVAPYPYDPERARELLIEAGYLESAD